MVRERDAYDRNGDGFSDIPKLNSETAGFRAYYKPSAYTRLRPSTTTSTSSAAAATPSTSRPTTPTSPSSSTIRLAAAG